MNRGEQFRVEKLRQVGLSDFAVNNLVVVYFADCLYLFTSFKTSTPHIEQTPFLYAHFWHRVALFC